jgi:hypothetical protein
MTESINYSLFFLELFFASYLFSKMNISIEILKRKKHIEYYQRDYEG